MMASWLSSSSSLGCSLFLFLARLRIFFWRLLHILLNFGLCLNLLPQAFHLLNQGRTRSL